MRFFLGLLLNVRGVKGGKAAGLACLAGIVMLPALSDTVFRRRPFITEKGPGEKAFFWTPVRPRLISELVDRGKVVFVDITAPWCLTCQLNKRTLFRNKAVL